MKKSLLAFLSLTTCTFAFAQVPVEVNWAFQVYPNIVQFSFEQPSDQNYIALDTAAGNLWQIGHPQKTNFTSAIYGQNSLVTDTMNAYPVNTISSFTMRVINYSAYLCTILQFQHKYLTTAGQDGGTIEVSHDQGMTWKNLVEDSFFLYDFNCGNGNPPYAITDIVAALGKPGFSGNSNGVQVVNVNFMPTHNFSMQNDTIDFRFTFASDSNAENLDGWMIDEFTIGAMGEGIPEYMQQEIIVFPNPSTGLVQFNGKFPAGEIPVSVYDVNGKLVAEQKIKNRQTDLSFLPDGIYAVIVNSGDKFSSQRVIIRH